LESQCGLGKAHPVVEELIADFVLDTSLRWVIGAMVRLMKFKGVAINYPKLIADLVVGYPRSMHTLGTNWGASMSGGCVEEDSTT